MMRVKERMNIYESDAYLVEKMRAQNGLSYVISSCTLLG